MSKVIKSITVPTNTKSENIPQNSSSYLPNESISINNGCLHIKVREKLFEGEWCERVFSIIEERLLKENPDQLSVTLLTDQGEEKQISKEELSKSLIKFLSNIKDEYLKKKDGWEIGVSGWLTWKSLKDLVAKLGINLPTELANYPNN